MNKTKVVLAVLAILFGVFMFVYGEYDDSPGGQFLGLVITVIGSVAIIRIWKKKSGQPKS